MHEIWFFWGGQITSFDVLWKAFSQFIQNISQAPLKCLFKWIKLDYFNKWSWHLKNSFCFDWIISISDRDIWKILFVLDSYEYLVRLEGKISDGIFFCVNKSDNYSVIYCVLIQNILQWWTKGITQMCYPLCWNEKQGWKMWRPFE